MKNLLLAGALGAMVFGFSSCKKDYNCDCTASFLGVTSDTTVSIGKLSKKDAESQCETEATSLGQGIIPVTCDAVAQ